MSYLAKCVFCFPIGVLPEWLPNYPPTRSWESSLSWCNSPFKSLFWYFPRIWLGFDSWDTFFLHAVLSPYIAGHLGGFALSDLASQVIPKGHLFVVLSHYCVLRDVPLISKLLISFWMVWMLLLGLPLVVLCSPDLSCDSLRLRSSPEKFIIHGTSPKDLSWCNSKRQFCLGQTKCSGFTHW